MLKTWALLAIIAGAVAEPTANAPNPADAIVGQWLAEEGDCRFEIYAADGAYCGKIIWMKETLYPAKDPEAGKPVHDRKNPDLAKRADPLVGLVLLKGFKYTADNSWTGGTIYDSDNGKTYSAKLWMTGKDELKVRGFIGISLLGGSTTWTRVKPTGRPPQETSSPPSK